MSPRHAPAAPRAAADARPGAPGEPTPSGARSRRWVAAALVTGIALIAAGGLTLYLAVRTMASTDELQQGQREQALLLTARAAVTDEYLALQRYRLEPTPSSQQQYMEAAGRVTTTLEDAATESTHSGTELTELATAQSTFRDRADKLVQLLAGGGADPVAYERTEVLAAYRLLVQRCDQGVLRAATATQQTSDAIDRLHVWIFVDTAAALGIGLGLAVWGLILVDRAGTQESEPTGPEPIDELTSLADRDKLYRLIHDALVVASRSEGRGVTVLVIGLNGVPALVRAHGSQAIDQLLLAASRRLRRVIRDDDTVARIGEQDFAVLLHEITDLKAIETVTGRIDEVLGRQFRLKSGIADVSANVGIAICEPDTEPENAVRRAETAMYRAAAAGGGVAFAQGLPGLNPEHESEIASGLRELLHNNDRDHRLTFEYQPVVRLADGAITRVRATAFWLHPLAGPLPQRDFLPVAEAHGLVAPLVGHLISELTAQAAEWRATNFDLDVSLEISPQCLSDSWFARAVASAMERTDLNPGALSVEISEAAIVSDPKVVVPALDSLRRLGVRVIVTGFGGAAATLANLGRVPVDELAADYRGSGVFPPAAQQQLLAQDAVRTAQTLGVPATIEGVTDEAALASLRRLGYQSVRGPALGAPVLATAVVAACQIAHERVLSAATPAAAADDLNRLPR